MVNMVGVSVDVSGLSKGKGKFYPIQATKGLEGE
jgi:hypothetical protein